MITKTVMVTKTVMATKTGMATSIVMGDKQATNSMVVILVVNLDTLPGIARIIIEVDLIIMEVEFIIPLSVSYVGRHTGQLIVPGLQLAKREETST